MVEPGEGAPNPNLQSQIKLELRLYQTEYKGTSRVHRFFGNFPGYLPEADGEPVHKKAFRSTSFWGQKHKERFISEDDRREHGPKFMNQTPEEFLATIERVRRELNISVGELNRLRSTRAPSGRITEAFYDYILPLYARLREMGYTREDLIK